MTSQSSRVAPPRGSLHSRPTLFEHGLLPIPSSMPSVEQLCDMVGKHGGGESKASAGRGAEGSGRLSISTWHRIAKESFKMDTGYAQLVFEIFFDCLDGLQGGSAAPQGFGETNEVDITEFAIYLFILSSYRDEALMGGTPRSLRADIAYPSLMRSPSNEAKEPGSPRSSPLSPRTVAAGTKSMDMERRQVIFLHKHMGELLLICAGAGDATRVTPQQFDSLGAVLVGAPNDDKAGEGHKLSSQVPSWRTGMSFPLALEELNSWVVDSLTHPEAFGRSSSGGAHGTLSPPRPFLNHEGTSPVPMMLDGQTPHHGHSSGQMQERHGVLVAAGLHKTTMIRSAAELMGASAGVAPHEQTSRMDIRLQNCTESYIYISAPVRRVTVTGCNQCTVYVAACAMLTVENCERLKVIAGCRRVRISNSVDSTLHLLAVRQPLLLGENHDLVLAPFNALASDCLQWWPMLHIDRAKNRWCEPLSLTKGSYGVALSGGAVAGQSLMQPDAFFCVTIPSNTPLPASVVAAQANPCPLPPQYAAALQSKHKQVLDLRKEIAEIETTAAAPKAALQRAIQAKFKEWLVTSGSLRQVQDLVHLDQQHQNGGDGSRGLGFAFE